MGEQLELFLIKEPKMKFNWKRYKKLIPAILGVSLLVWLNYLDIKIIGLDAVVIDTIIGATTVWGVYEVKNEE